MTLALPKMGNVTLGVGRTGGGQTSAEPQIHVPGVCAAAVGAGQRQLPGACIHSALCPRPDAPSPPLPLRLHR